MDHPINHSIAPMGVRSQLRSLSRPRDKAPTRQRKPKRHRYVLTMSTGRDTVRYPERAQAFAAWIDQVFALFQDRLEWSKSKVIKASGVSRSAVYRWRDTGENGQFPDPEILDRFCANLYRELPSPLLEPEIPYGILGWGKPGSMASARVDALAEQTPTALEGKIRRVRAILRGNSLTPAQREKYEGLLGDFETAYERVIDTIIDDLDHADSGPEEPE